MIRLLTLFLALFGTFCSLRLYAQSLTGVWRGSLTSPFNPSLTLPGVLSLRQTGPQVRGELVLQADGMQEKYVLQGTAEGNHAVGTATFPAQNVVFQFEVLLSNGQLITAVGLNSLPVLAGTLARDGYSTGQAVVPGPKTASPRPSANRDSRVVGK